MVEISTSILSIKKEDCMEVFSKLEMAHTDYFHIDVMDGKFVEKNTVQKMIEYSGYIKNMSNIPLDVHLMVKDLPQFINTFGAFKPNIITFHLESIPRNKVKEIIRLIKENNTRVGISIKPNTKLADLYEFLPFIHVVLIMCVEPGKGGQKMLEESITKIKELKKYITENHIDIDIEVDGGINLENVQEVKDAGSNIIVAGTSIINSNNYKDTIKNLKGTADNS
ncbi:MAG: ribulose-phosphate 3-epimerase [Clostridia bacterium]|nr:ribulose-phosphate 3-epimerase [Clostridia bacterium]